MKIMEKNTSISIMEAIKAFDETSERIKEIKNKMKNFKYSERTESQYVALAEEEIYLGFKAAYDRENIIVIAGTYCLNVLENIWNKYEGKKLGPKTKEKIEAEFYEATNKNFKFYVSSDRDIIFIHLNSEGFTSHVFNYQELDFYLPYGTSYKDAENKIIAINTEDCNQYHGIKKFKNSADAAAEMVKKAREAQEKAHELNELICELNKIHPQKRNWIKEYNEVRYIERL